MGKLTNLKPQLARLGSSLAFMPEGKRETDRYRNGQSWRAWYRTTRWRKLRWAVLVRDLFTCCRCRKVVADTSKLVADHKRAHRGDEHLFWDESNLQAMCTWCHSSAKQREEQGRPAD